MKNSILDLGKVLNKVELNKTMGGIQEEPIYGCVLRPENPMENR